MNTSSVQIIRLSMNWRDWVARWLGGNSRGPVSHLAGSEKVHLLLIFCTLCVLCDENCAIIRPAWVNKPLDKRL